MKHFNFYCSYDFMISNTSAEYDVNVEGLILEKNVDFVKYTYEDVGGQKIVRYADGNSDRPGDFAMFTLFGYPNGSQRHYFWELELDGSIPSSGTDIEPCLKENSRNFAEVTLMKIDIRRENYDLTMEVEGNMDIFIVYSDGKVVFYLEVNTFNSYENEYVVFLNSSKENIFEVITFSSRLSKQLKLQTVATTIPPIAYNANLTSDVPFVIIDTGFYHLKTVKIQNLEVTILTDF
uniref:Uncharacterized protein n=1 Tax=Panagrolaimus davidi TaxID=227884 RepID=A0A914Q0Z9_9BILA